MSTTPRKLFVLSFCFAFIVACGEKQKENEEPVLPQSTRTVTSDLRVRLSPNTMAAEIGRLSLGEELRILNRSKEKVKIGSNEAYWYHIATNTGLKGWVYGAHLDVEATKDTLESNKQVEEKLHEMITGRWYVTQKRGSLTETFLTLYSNGTFEIGNHNKVTSKGNYSVEVLGNTASIILEGEKLTLTSITAELRGDTLTMKAMRETTTVTLSLVDKSPKPLDTPATP